MSKSKVIAVIGIGIATLFLSGCTVHYDHMPPRPHRIERPMHKAPPPMFHHVKPAPPRPFPGPHRR